MAEGVLRDALHPRHVARSRILSAGVAAYPDLPASENSILACSEIGVDISAHRSQPLTVALMKESDVVLGLELHHVFAAKELSPTDAHKVHLLGAFAGQNPDLAEGVPDPYGGPIEEYREVLRFIRGHLARGLPRIEGLIESRMVES